jgi:predicted Zn-dependent peptidase
VKLEQFPGPFRRPAETAAEPNGKNRRMDMPPFQSDTVAGYPVHVLQTGKFKTNTIVVHFRHFLEKETATAFAMIPHLLMRGSEQYPTHEQLMQRLGDLYGAGMYAEVRKKGDFHIAEFSVQVANESFLLDKPSLLDDAFALLGEILFHPVTEGDGFEPERLEKEKEQHRKRMESVIDDKIAYAAERCLLAMCKDERYGVPRLGFLEDLENVNPGSAYSVYREMVARDPVDVYVAGAVSPEEVARYLERYFPARKETRVLGTPEPVRRHVAAVRQVVDRMDVSQGKLNIGCRTQVAYPDPEYPALLVYNAVLGGFPTSKLFTNVREKASLAYYASSRLESHKGILYVQSGIDVEHFEKAKSIILEQFAAMRRGEILEEEMHGARMGLINQYRELMDSAYGQIDVHYNGVISGRERTLEDLEQAVQQVTLPQVTAVANGVEIDTIYFLRNEEGSRGETNGV